MGAGQPVAQLTIGIVDLHRGRPGTVRTRVAERRRAQRVGKRRRVPARLLLELVESHQPHAVVGGDPLQGGHRVGGRFGVIGKRDDACVLGTEAAVVHLQVPPARDGTDHLAVGFPALTVSPATRRPSPRVEPAVAITGGRSVRGRGLEHVPAEPARPLQAQTVAPFVAGMAVAARGVDPCEPRAAGFVQRPEEIVLVCTPRTKADHAFREQRGAGRLRRAGRAAHPTAGSSAGGAGPAGTGDGSGGRRSRAGAGSCTGCGRRSGSTTMGIDFPGSPISIPTIPAPGRSQARSRANLTSAPQPPRARLRQTFNDPPAGPRNRRPRSIPGVRRPAASARPQANSNLTGSPANAPTRMRATMRGTSAQDPEKHNRKARPAGRPRRGRAAGDAPAERRCQHGAGQPDVHGDVAAGGPVLGVRGDVLRRRGRSRSSSGPGAT